MSSHNSSAGCCLIFSNSRFCCTVLVHIQKLLSPVITIPQQLHKNTHQLANFVLTVLETEEEKY